MRQGSLKSGSRFNSWTVVDRDRSRRSKSAYYLCRCDCGREQSVRRGHLISDASRQCRSCLGRAPLAGYGDDLTDRRFGQVVVLRRSDRYNGTSNKLWVIRCDCGVESTDSARILLAGLRITCGQPHSPQFRLRNFIVEDGACWRWVGTMDRHGYGRLWVHARAGQIGAHVATYECLFGPVPTGLELDHLCRHPWCVNPLHLEPVTHQVNVRRGDSPAGKHARQTHCKRGHLLPEASARGQRRCSECERLHALAARSRELSAPRTDGESLFGGYR